MWSSDGPAYNTQPLIGPLIGDGVTASFDIEDREGNKLYLGSSNAALLFWGGMPQIPYMSNSQTVGTFYIDGFKLHTLTPPGEGVELYVIPLGLAATYVHPEEDSVKPSHLDNTKSFYLNQILQLRDGASVENTEYGGIRASFHQYADGSFQFTNNAHESLNIGTDGHIYSGGYRFVADQSSGYDTRISDDATTDHYRTYDSAGNLVFRIQSTSLDGAGNGTTRFLSSNDYYFDRNVEFGNNVIFDGGEAMITVHDDHGNFNLKAGVDEDNTVVSGTGSGGSHIQMNDGGTISLKYYGGSEGTMATTSNSLTLDNSMVSTIGDIEAYASDQRLKEDITPMENALERVNKLRGVDFTWTDEAESMGFTPKHKRESGVIAQEVQDVLPDAVSKAPFNNEYLTVQKERLVPLLIQAMNELTNEVRSLQEEVDSLKGGGDSS
mgnify:CR=1 FL=1